MKVNQRAAEEIDSDSEKEEGAFRSIVSSLKKRKEQRKEQKDSDKKRRGAKSGGGGVEDEKFVMQAAAANRQIAVAESKNMIEFLQIAKDSSVYDDTEMKEMFTRARDSIFGASKEKEPEKEPEPELTNDASDHLDSDGDDIYE